MLLNEEALTLLGELSLAKLLQARKFSQLPEELRLESEKHVSLADGLINILLTDKGIDCISSFSYCCDKVL